jgi:hypothetical protein
LTFSKEENELKTILDASKKVKVEFMRFSPNISREETHALKISLGQTAKTIPKQRYKHEQNNF